MAFSRTLLSSFWMKSDDTQGLLLYRTRSEILNHAREEAASSSGCTFEKISLSQDRNDRNDLIGHNYITKGHRRPVLGKETATFRDSLGLWWKRTQSRSMTRVLDFGRVLPIYSKGTHLFPWRESYLRVHPTDLWWNIVLVPIYNFIYIKISDSICVFRRHYTSPTIIWTTLYAYSDSTLGCILRLR